MYSLIVKNVTSDNLNNGFLASLFFPIFVCQSTCKSVYFFNKISQNFHKKCYSDKYLLNVFSESICHTFKTKSQIFNRFATISS